MKNRSFLSFFPYFVVFFAGFSLNAQEIVTAGRYLEMVSERYSSIRDYEARIVIQNGTVQMNGNVSHLGPNFLRIDFTSPAEQVIVYNGESLMVYLPGDRAILNQNVGSQGEGANLATSRGLTLLRRNYIPAFVVGPEPTPLEEGSGERVVKLRLARRSASEGFREIILDVDPETRLIRRITGRTVNEITVRFDFSNIRLNQGIPEQRFVFDAPPATNMFNNFLFKDSE
ncbi:MAG: outer membrane lipoprotein carrier protein LolA [Treponema sp.]|jgi:outer membrane lipoprotein-sorting protein|nr:outer membrane lipoprotein carrier protein LolA [Treponema sp.]